MKPGSDCVWMVGLFAVLYMATCVSLLQYVVPNITIRHINLNTHLLQRAACTLYRFVYL